MSMAEKKLILTLSSEPVNSPITFRAVRDFELEKNILQAELNERGGKLTIPQTARRK
jgi:hypothetical protein